MKVNAVVSFEGLKDIDAAIHLTGSKSESNRALVIAALSKGLVAVHNLSDAADTVILNRILTDLDVSQKAVTAGSSAEDHGVRVSSAISGSAAEGDQATDVQEERKLVNVGHAGTAMRFLTAYLSTLPQRFTLTGSGRMQERPIGILVDALRTLGADIAYEKNEGFPPLLINGGLSTSLSEVTIKGNVSSQYLSALLIIAPTLPEGLSLHIEGGLTSRPYLEMTLNMLGTVGVTHTWENDTIQIPHQEYLESSLTVEPDWSAASYWYSIAALADQASLTLPNLREESLQGDSEIQRIMVNFGVNTTHTNEGIQLVSGPEQPITSVMNLKDCPDLAQTIIVCAAAKGLNLAFTGLETLKIKETNRVLALQNELAKIGVVLIEENEVYTLDCGGLYFPEKITISTYDDHRMAMAFAPLSLLIREVEIEDYHVVEKSYPDYWKDLEKAGFIVKEL
jgi:3-phosphoshikimate 1-carboxyvinyltransferase